ncbi:NADH-ubiquinone oxidoreductase chain 2, partial [Cucurbita argyrosperma subsp. argyrosperma]
EMLPPTMKGKARRREGKENAFGDRDWISFSSKTRGWPTDSSLRALPALDHTHQEFRLGPGKRWQQKEGVHVAAAPAPFLVNGSAGSASTSEKRESTSDNHGLCLLGCRALFSLIIPRSLSSSFHSGEFSTCGALSIPSLKPRRKPPSPSDSISLLTLYMWAPNIYEGSPTPVTAFLPFAPKISIFANISRLSIYGSYGATLQQIFFFCSIASMILGALAAMAQTKVKRPLAHSSIGHVGYIRTSFSCGTIEGIQSLLIGIFIYVFMTIDAFAIVLALRQTRVKYLADLGALAKTHPISAITFSITMFSYAGIPPLAGFCSKFYLFFAALGCGAYFLAPVGVVTSVIGRWAAGRLPRVSQSVWETEGSSPCTGHVAYRISCDTDGNACSER